LVATSPSENSGLDEDDLILPGRAEGYQPGAKEIAKKVAAIRKLENGTSAQLAWID
jgi:hypothetical protein